MFLNAGRSNGTNVTFELQDNNALDFDELQLNSNAIMTQLLAFLEQNGQDNTLLTIQIGMLVAIPAADA